MLTQKQVKHIAQLARLGITQKETAKFSKEFSSILDYVSDLDQVGTESVKPTSQVTGLVNVMREDRVEKFGREKELVKLAPENKGGCIKTKPILE